MYKINKFQFNLSSDIDIYEKNLKFVSKNSTGFRFWYYFRTGYATYFAFILAAINTLTVTYFLAIERFPALQSVFPTFGQYVLIITLIGIPLLTGIGFVHYKRTKAFNIFFSLNKLKNCWKNTYEHCYISLLRIVVLIFMPCTNIT